MNVPIGLVLLAAGLRWLPRLGGGRGRIDLAGVATLGPTVLAFVLPLVLGQEEHWPAWGWACLAASAVGIVVFAVVERWVSRRGGHPIVSGQVLRLPGLASSIVAIFLVMAVFSGFLFTLTLHLQEALGDSALRAALTFAPTGIAFAAVSLSWRRLPARTAIRDTVRMASPSYSESIIIARSADALYDLVSDVTRMGEWSPVCKACWWDDGAGARAGAWFTGRNEASGRTWETRSEVVTAARGREFAFVVGGAWVRWGYTFTPVDGGTQVTESWEFLPAGLARFGERYGADAQAQIADRTEAARTGIPLTLAAIKRTAELA